MFHVVLYQPEIPPNTGNIIRLCANTGSHLHLIEPLAFELDDKRLRRAGLDYHEYADLRVHKTLDHCLESHDRRNVHALSTRGTNSVFEHKFYPGDVLLFGPETRGLPQYVLDDLPPSQCLRLPMRPAQRSLNLSNTVAVVIYEAWRQNGFADPR